MTEEEFKTGKYSLNMQGGAAPRSGSLSGEEVAEVRAWLRMKGEEKLKATQYQAEREAMMNAPRFRNEIPPSNPGFMLTGPGMAVQTSGPREVARALPHLPSGWANGFKTSEFWTAVAGVVLAAAKGYGYNIPEDAFWSIVAYVIGRSGMKAAAAYRSGIKQ